MSERMNFTLDSQLSFKSFVELNSGFALAECAIAYHGKNRNGTNIPREAFVNALPSLKNCPVVTNYDIKTGELGGHDIDAVITDAGELRLINATVPFGVVPESASQYWSKVTDTDGTEHEYLNTEILLWRRQPAYQYFEEHQNSKHSMEIHVTGNCHSDEDGYMVVEEFEFDALCAIGCTPCFENSTIQLKEPITATEYKLAFNQMFSDLKELVLAQPGVVVAFGAPKEVPMTKDRMLEIVAEFSNVSAEGLDFDSHAESTEDEFRAYVQEIARTNTMLASFNASALGQYAVERDAIAAAVQSALAPVDQYDESGAYVSGTRAYYCAHDAERVYAMVCNGTSTAIEPRVCHSARYVYDNEKGTWVIQDAFEPVEFERKDESTVQRLEGELATLRAEFEAYQASHSTANEEVETLRAFRDERVAEDHKAEMEAVLDEFTELDGNVEFEAIRENMLSYSDTDALRTACYVVVGKAAKLSFSKAPDSAKGGLPIPPQVQEKVPYGGLVERYAKK